MLLEPFISVITLPGFFFIKLDVVVRTRLRVTIEKGFRIFSSLNCQVSGNSHYNHYYKKHCIPSVSQGLALTNIGWLSDN